MNTAVLFTLLLIFATLSLPIGVSLGMATLIVMYQFTNIPLSMITQNVFAGLDSFALLAIPFFMLSGNLMALGGIARRIVELADYVFSKITGGLAIVNVVACMFFAAISGSGPATVSAIGSIMIPEMDKRGYDKAFSTGLTATAGTIGVIIPPSIPFVIYGVVAGASIGDIFIAGIIPGIIIGLALIAVAYYSSKKKGYKGVERKRDQTFWEVFKDSFWALLAPVIILGGIYGGIFTPTEASVVAIVYSLFAGIFIYKELTWKIWVDSLKQTADLNGMTGLAIAFSMAFAQYLSVEQIPVAIGAFLSSAITSDTIMMLLILTVLIIVGCFVDNISSCLILTPVFLPLVTSMGVDPIHFGVFMTIALAIGFVTPPYGANLFVASAVANMRYEKIAKAAAPFLIVMFICLLLITFIPEISMSLVYLMRR
ncbi:MAG: TRAP transporter large permease [Tissierellia bacterium]|nr:TRAP transporter large permease [Tissierellia bacterium]